MDAGGYRGRVHLADRDREILDFEARWVRHDARKEEAVRTELHITPARYYQLLGRLLESPDALAYDPVLIHRLRRLRDVRRERRGAEFTGAAG